MSTTNLGLDTIETTDSIQNAFLTKMNSNMQKLDNAYGLLKAKLLQKTGKNNLNDAINYIDQLVNAQDGTITADKVFNGYVGYKGLQRIVGTALATASTGSAPHLLSGLKLYDSSGNLITGTMPNKHETIQDASGSLSGDYYQMSIPVSGYYTLVSKLQRKKANVISDLGIKVMPTINVTLSGTNASYVSGYGAGIDQNGVLVIWAMCSGTANEHISFTNTSIGAGTIGSGWGITSFDIGDPVDVPHACTITGLGSYSTINITLNANTRNTSYDYVGLAVTLTAS